MGFGEAAVVVGGAAAMGVGFAGGAVRWRRDVMVEVQQEGVVLWRESQPASQPSPTKRSLSNRALKSLYCYCVTTAHTHRQHTHNAARSPITAPQMPAHREHCVPERDRNNNKLKNVRPQQVIGYCHFTLHTPYPPPSLSERETLIESRLICKW